MSNPGTRPPTVRPTHQHVSSFGGGTSTLKASKQALWNSRSWGWRGSPEGAPAWRSARSRVHFARRGLRPEKHSPRCMVDGVEMEDGGRGVGAWQTGVVINERRADCQGGGRCVAGGESGRLLVWRGRAALTRRRALHTLRRSRRLQTAQGPCMSSLKHGAIQATSAVGALAQGSMMHHRGHPPYAMAALGLLGPSPTGPDEGTKEVDPLRDCHCA